MAFTSASHSIRSEDEAAREILDAMKADFPDHQPGMRPLHAVGTGAIGWFRPTEVASKYCRSPHFAPHSETPVRVRFSNGNGQADPDGQLQVRGMAIRFYVGATLMESDGQDGVRHTATGEDAPTDADGDPIVRRDVAPIVMTDLLCMSVPVFVATDIEGTLEFQHAVAARKVRRPSMLARLKSIVTMCPIPPQEHGVTHSGAVGAMTFANTYRPAQGFIVESSMLRLPESYARTMYHAVHAFAMQDGEGRTRMVRFFVEPTNGVRAKGPGEPPQSLIGAALKQPTINEYGTTLPERYLTSELAERLARGPSHFNLRIQIADPWDDTKDPTKPWPMSRPRVLLGTITLERPVHDQGAECDHLSFNPGRLIDGIAPSDDPVFAARAAAYEESYRRRMAGLGLPVSADECPVHRASTPPPTVSSVH